MSDNDYIRLYISEKTEWLVINHPNAFLLLSWIARKAATIDYNPDHLELGECYIRDHQGARLTRQKYQTTLKFLIDKNFIEIIEATSEKKRRGRTLTKVKLIDSTVYDINIHLPPKETGGSNV